MAALPDTPEAAAEPVIRVTGLTTRFGAETIHEGLDLEVMRGEILGIVGGSGSGKSVLVRTILGLIRPAAGRIEIFGREMGPPESDEARAVERRIGMLFQDGALFSSMTVAENVEVPLAEHTGLAPRLRREIALLKVGLVGLPRDAADKYPAELSGGMRKRAGLARAIALDPDIVFLDEPTAGLDPIGATQFDRLIAELSATIGLTVVMVTHDLDSLNAICDRIAVLLDKRIRVGTMGELMHDPHPWLQAYFHGPRARAARPADDEA